MKISELVVVDSLHDRGYITDDAFQRYKRHLAEGIVAEYYAHKMPWWKMW